MKNYEKIKLIEEIVQPYFNFEMDDFYGDKGGLPYPKIEELTRLYFKKNGKDKNLITTKEEEQIMIDKIKNLNIGSVELIKIPSFGVYIYINMTLEKEYYYLFNAVEMWVDTLIELCDENKSNSHTCDYSYFIANVLNNKNTESEVQIKQSVNDFYDYFYIKEHICDINKTFGQIDNNYGKGKHKLRLLDILNKIEDNHQSKTVFQKITIYVFQMFCSFRKELGFKIFEDKEKDKYITQYFTRYP